MQRADFVSQRAFDGHHEIEICAELLFCLHHVDSSGRGRAVADDGMGNQFDGVAAARSIIERSMAASASSAAVARRDARP